MLYLNIDEGCLIGHKQFSVTVDETTVNFGNIPTEILIDVLKEFKAETEEAIKNLHS